MSSQGEEIKEPVPVAPEIISIDPDQIDKIDNRDKHWSYDQNGKPYRNYKDRNGTPYDPWYVVGKTFYNYYITYISLFMHFMTMWYLLDSWCRYSKLVMFYSFQCFLLHAYSWAVPNRQYGDWVQDKKVFFIFLATLNITGYFATIALGSYLYEKSLYGIYDGMTGYFGVSLMIFTVATNTPQMIMLGLTIKTL